MKLVKATEQDKAYFRELNRQAYHSLVIRQFGDWDESLQNSNFELKWREQDFHKVYIDNVLIGAIWVQEFEDHHLLREIQLMPECRNKGFGTCLIEAEILRAKRANKELRLKVLTQNPAFKLYKRLGFAITESKREFYRMAHQD